MSGAEPVGGPRDAAGQQPADDPAAIGLGGLLTEPRVAVDSVVPPLVFVSVHAAAGLRWAAAASLGLAFALVAWRVGRGQRPLFAMTGLAGALVSAGLALVSGRASAWFVPGIVGNALFGLACVVSVVLRRPVIALTSRALYRWPWAWYAHERVRPAYSEITWVWAIVYLARAAVQAWLVSNDAVASLAVVRVVTGLPVFVALLAATYGYVNWRLRSLGAPPVAQFARTPEPQR